MEYLEKQYSPSLFTKRFQNSPKPNEEVIKHFITVSENATKLAREMHKSRLNVRYGIDNQLLDIYYKEQEEGTPIFVYIHGGFWQFLDKNSSGPLVHTLIEYNYRVILVDYNLCPDVTLQQITEQICNFYKWLNIYGKETKANKIVICGHSAGAHLSLQMFKEQFLSPLLQLNLIDQLFLISGLYDLRELWPLKTCNPNNILNLNAERARDLSPLCWQYKEELIRKYQSQHVKVHVLVAENDSEIFKKQSKELYKRFKEIGLDVVYKEFENYDHFDIIEDCINRNSFISKYISRSLQLSD